MRFSASAKRRAVARLANVSASPAVNTLTLAAARLCQILTQSSPVQEHEFLEADDALAEAIAAMPGSFEAQLDFLSVLHGKDAQLSQHRLRNVSASLRGKAARLGQLPTEADFPSDHPTSLFASAYWGGIAAWSAGSADRAQHRKGYWASRENQIAAIRALAVRHPNIPMTHALLHAAGLHRLGLILNAAELQTLADEAGVERNLRYRPDGWWSQARVIDAYAEACRKAGVTLSTTALSAIGGEASALRSYAKAHFATFRAFQRAVVEKYPDIKLPDRPVAADGTPLDSWSEVPVYNALRLALPEVRIEAHVIIAGERARSTDFVLDDRVWVEVLGIAVDAMATPTSARQAKYAADWKAKSACYVALGIDPVLIEPDDIHDVKRLAARITEIATRLRYDPLPLNPPSGKHTRAKGFWTFDTLCAAVEEVAREGSMPTYSALQKAGYGHACCLLKEPGMRESVTTALGLFDPNRKDVWTRKRVVAELAQWVRGRETYPTEAELRQARLGALGSARSRLWAGQGEALRKAVGAAAGITVPRRRAPDRSYEAIEQVAAALAPLAEQLGRMPTGDEATAAGLGTAWAHASRRGGVLSMAERIGVPCQTRRDCSRPAMLAAFSDLVTSLGDVRLTTTLIRTQLGAGGLAWVRKLGGMNTVRAAIADMKGSGSSAG